LHLPYLFSNGIGIVGASSIATMLMTNKSLMELDLRQNLRIGEEGVILIVKSLKQNKSLSTLKLDGIPVGDGGAVVIALLLTTNFSGKEIYMPTCQIGDAGAIAISDALKTNNSLTYLCLLGNKFSSSNIAAEFAPMLKINTSLKDLRLGYHKSLLE
jgi:NLR family CARD domain-containing protein 3